MSVGCPRGCAPSHAVEHAAEEGHPRMVGAFSCSLLGMVVDVSSPAADAYTPPSPWAVRRSAGRLLAPPRTRANRSCQPRRGSWSSWVLLKLDKKSGPVTPQVTWLPLLPRRPWGATDSPVTALQLGGGAKFGEFADISVCHCQSTTPHCQDQHESGWAQSVVIWRHSKCWCGWAV